MKPAVSTVFWGSAAKNAPALPTKIQWRNNCRPTCATARPAIEARYRTLIELSPQLLWIARPDGGFTFCNQHWIEYTGLSTAQSGERGWIAAVDPSHRSRVLQAWLQATVAGAALDMEIPFRRAADEQCRWHLARAQPVRDSKGNIIHWMGIALDIHDRRQAVAALEDADRRKDEFLATLAHELRNPLAPLRNALYLLQLREHARGSATNP